MLKYRLFHNLEIRMQLPTFGFGMQRAYNQAIFNAHPRRDQDQILQTIYDQGYSGSDLEKFFGIPASTIYSRINANRGRGPAPAT